VHCSEILHTFKYWSDALQKYRTLSRLSLFLFVADQPGCTVKTNFDADQPDGVDCTEQAVEMCTSAITLHISTVDAAVHLRRKFELPILRLPGSGRRLQRVGDGVSNTLCF
jgi:hypothetical protein